MPWQCRLIEFKKGMHPRRDGGLKVGDMFYAPLEDDEDLTPSIKFLIRGCGEYYRANNSYRRPLLLVIPGPMLFCVDTRAWKDGIFYDEGWTVTGHPPLITMLPSINVGGTYHGFLTNGILTDDCEQRVFDEDGYERKP